jgi:hypothetical protein
MLSCLQSLQRVTITTANSETVWRKSKRVVKKIGDALVLALPRFTQTVYLHGQADDEYGQPAYGQRYIKDMYEIDIPTELDFRYKLVRRFSRYQVLAA